MLGGLVNMLSISRKKGISPLIATVLLVAFTISVGIFLSRWAHNLAKTEAETVTNNANKNCAFANFQIDWANYYPLKKQLVIKVVATGTQSIEIGDVEVINKTFYEKIYAPDEFVYPVTWINPGDARLIVIDNVIDNVTSVRISLKNCPQNSYDTRVTVIK